MVLTKRKADSGDEIEMYAENDCHVGGIDHYY